MRMDVAEHADDPRLVEANRLRTPDGIAPEIEGPVFEREKTLW